jgi:DNA-binding response OmpR family regulator
LIRRERLDAVVLGRLIDPPDVVLATVWLKALLEPRTPLVVLGRRSGTSERQFVLGAGADEYVPPPTSGPILVARLRDVLRTMNPRALGTVYKAGDVVLDDEHRLVIRRGREVHLSKTEYDVLRLLISSPGRIFSRREIIDHVWGAEADILERAIDVLLKRIRQALGVTRGNDPIATVRGRGYGM